MRKIPQSLITAVKRADDDKSIRPNRAEHLKLAEMYLLDYYTLVDTIGESTQRIPDHVLWTIEMKMKLAIAHALLAQTGGY